MKLPEKDRPHGRLGVPFGTPAGEWGGADLREWHGKWS